MLITRETDYALRILRSLSDGRHYTAGELAQREILPQKFTYKILKKLEKAGIVQIIRGSNGGCSLAANLREVSLFELIEAVENKAQLTCCMETGYECEWVKEQGRKCTIHEQLCQVQAAIDRELSSRSLYQIIFGDG